MQDKFRLDLSDEEAVHYMQSLIDESVGALFAAVVEQIHKFAQVCFQPVIAVSLSVFSVKHCICVCSTGADEVTEVTGDLCRRSD